MANIDQYADWLVKNQDKAGTPEFDTVASAYKMARQEKPKAPVTPDRNPTDDMSIGQKALAGAGKFFVGTANGAQQLLGIGDQKALQKRIDYSKQLDAPLMKTGAGMAGNIGAGILSALPTAMIPGANAVVGGGAIGAALGALNPVAEGESRLNNVALGGAGGAAGSALAKALGRTTNPVQSQLTPELQALARKAEGMGIPLDAADKTGSRPLKVIRSVLESLPLTADKQGAITEAKRMAFNRAALANVGESADKATPEVLNAARQRIGGEFNRLTSNKSITLGQDFLDTLVKVEGAVTPFSSPAIRTAVDNGMEVAVQSPLSGSTYQKIRSVLGGASSDAFKGSNSELGQALKSIRGGLDDAAAQSMSGQEQAAWKAANNQWQNLKVLEKAAAPVSADAVAGNVSPAKLAQALMSVDKQGSIYGTRGDTMGDLARVGQAFVKEQIPNSGTAERTFWQSMLTGNPLDALYKGAVGGVSVPAQALINSKAGQAYFSNGMLPLNDTTKRLADLLRQGAVGGGAVALPLQLEQ
jgi:hypothetical protein